MPKILLVEDNDMNRDMMSRWLVSKGYDVVTAIDGEEAIRKGLDDSPDLILMDLGLAKIDGWEATRQLKATAETSHVPIIAVTGYVMEGDRDKALEAGCDEYSAKPVDFGRLQEMIQALLQRGPPKPS